MSFPKPTSTIPCTSKYWEPDPNADYFLRCDLPTDKSVKKGTIVDTVKLGSVKGAGWREYSFRVKETGETHTTYYEWLLVKENNSNRFLFQREKEIHTEIAELKESLHYLIEDYGV